LQNQNKNSGRAAKLQQNRNKNNKRGVSLQQNKNIKQSAESQQNQNKNNKLVINSQQNQDKSNKRVVRTQQSQKKNQRSMESRTLSKKVNPKSNKRIKNLKVLASLLAKTRKIPKLSKLANHFLICSYAKFRMPRWFLGGKVSQFNITSPTTINRFLRA